MYRLLINKNCFSLSAQKLNLKPSGSFVRVRAQPGLPAACIPRTLTGQDQCRRQSSSSDTVWNTFINARALIWKPCGSFERAQERPGLPAACIPGTLTSCGECRQQPSSSHREREFENLYEYDWLTNTNRLWALEPHSSWCGGSYPVTLPLPLLHAACSFVTQIPAFFSSSFSFSFSYFVAVRADKRKWFIRVCVCMRVNVIRPRGEKRRELNEGWAREQEVSLSLKLPPLASRSSCSTQRSPRFDIK